MLRVLGFRHEERAFFAAEENSVGLARRWLRRVLDGHPRLDDAVCLLSETITNAIVHTRSSVIEVAVLRERGELVVEVADEGAVTVPVACAHVADRLAEGGRGIPLIRALAARWGFFQEGARCVVWFVLAADEAR